MKIKLMKPVEFEVTHLLVNAGVRYWEDASVNGAEDSDGSLIPLRNGDCWRPIIDLATGVIRDWPAGTVADIHYKVCDAGEYFFLDANGDRIAKYKSDYVPDILCPKGGGHGDYIIMKVDAEGKINDWRVVFDDENWIAV